MKLRLCEHKLSINETMGQKYTTRLTLWAKTKKINLDQNKRSAYFSGKAAWLEQHKIDIR